MMAVPVCGRRAVLGLAGAAALAPGRASAAARRRNWVAFRDRFVAPDGRVVDTGNGGISHSEGQGWAMLLAAAMDDRVAFHLVHGWTRRHLSRPGDALFSWRFRPGHRPPVDDPNNATDGDLYIAWALIRAARRWQDPALLAAASAIGQDVLRLLTREQGGQLLLLPGAHGFEDARRFVVNPSYLVFPAFAALDQAVPDARWRQLTSDGLRLLREARFGRWGLPPDWLAVSRPEGRLSPAEGWPPRFSYDAVRVPLLLAWGGHRTAPAAQAALRFWQDPEHAAPAAWVDLTTDTRAPYPASGGIRAVAALLRGQAGDASWALAPQDDYYAAALKMLVLVAEQDDNT
jgi:endoglucanase